ncbi:uncharacterized protein PAC_02143 [Phialocephala subalpina]|uniref:Uncharacterized protein n=1 Tax=Phialocephala subalpina TaxID=576137 RepID=A0A1L7WHL4_9HELO|nr:uncharacterized protein PAC_02143 [Phialocephala subalpina]
MSPNRTATENSCGPASSDNPGRDVGVSNQADRNSSRTSRCPSPTFSRTSSLSGNNSSQTTQYSLASAHSDASQDSLDSYYVFDHSSEDSRNRNEWPLDVPALVELHSLQNIYGREVCFRHCHEVLFFRRPRTSRECEERQPIENFEDFVEKYGWEEFFFLYNKVTETYHFHTDADLASAGNTLTSNDGDSFLWQIEHELEITTSREFWDPSSASASNTSASNTSASNTSASDPGSGSLDHEARESEVPTEDEDEDGKKVGCCGEMECTGQCFNMYKAVYAEERCARPRRGRNLKKSAKVPITRIELGSLCPPRRRAHGRNTSPAVSRTLFSSSLPLGRTSIHSRNSQNGLTEDENASPQPDKAPRSRPPSERPTAHSIYSIPSRSVPRARSPDSIPSEGEAPTSPQARGHSDNSPDKVGESSNPRKRKVRRPAQRSWVPKIPPSEQTNCPNEPVEDNEPPHSDSDNERVVSPSRRDSGNHSDGSERDESDGDGSDRDESDDSQDRGPAHRTPQITTVSFTFNHSMGPKANIASSSEQEHTVSTATDEQPCQSRENGEQSSPLPQSSPSQDLPARGLEVAPTSEPKENARTILVKLMESGNPHILSFCASQGLRLANGQLFKRRVAPRTEIPTPRSEQAPKKEENNDPESHVHARRREALVTVTSPDNVLSAIKFVLLSGIPARWRQDWTQELRSLLSDFEEHGNEALLAMDEAPVRHWSSARMASRNRASVPSGGCPAKTSSPACRRVHSTRNQAPSSSPSSHSGLSTILSPTHQELLSSSILNSIHASSAQTATTFRPFARISSSSRKLPASPETSPAKRGMGDFTEEMINSEILKYIEGQLHADVEDEEDDELPPLVPDVESSAKSSTPAKARSGTSNRFSSALSRLSSLRRPAPTPKHSTTPPDTPPLTPSSPSRSHRRFKLEDLDLEVDGTGAERLAGAEARLDLLENHIRHILPVLEILPGLSGMLDTLLEEVQCIMRGC